MCNWIDGIRKRIGIIKIQTDYTYKEWFIIINNLVRKIFSSLKFVQNQCIGSN